MLTLVKKRYEELVLRLGELDDQYEPENPPADHTPVVMTVVNEMADTLSNYAFAGDAEEIAFNREGLVPLLSLACYESEKYGMLRILYYGTEADFNRYCMSFLCRITDFINRHYEFFSYCLAGRRDLDARYFLRSSEANKQVTDMSAAFLDKDVFAAHSLLAAAIIGYTRNLLDIDSFYQPPAEEAAPVSRNLQWTDTAVACVELIYALYANGSFNHGQATLKEIARHFERIFHIDLGNIYRVYQDTLYRKSGTTAFLDRLRKKLEDFED